MAKFLIKGGRPLSGSIRIGGSKNAVLPMLAATLLTQQECTLTNVPNILDVRNFLEILRNLGARVTHKNHQVTICCSRITRQEPNNRLVSSMRASVVLLGALLARNRYARMSYPGGDLIGARPVDVHLRSFRALGAVVTEGRKLTLKAQKLQGSTVYAESSVTGTENIILASILARGKTTIKLAAEEPHVVALCRFLKMMGAKIAGTGSHTLTIQGVPRLYGGSMRVIPDMIEAGSFGILAAATRSEVIIQAVDHSFLDAVYNKFLEMGVNFDKRGSTLIINRPRQPYQAAVIRTGLYPNLATDLQPPFGVLATQAQGKSVIHDWIFEGRLGYLAELKKMGARARLIDAHRAEIIGSTPLFASRIKSLDIRSGMTLLIAALVARGKSEIRDIHHIDRGYENIDSRLRALGANIIRLE